MPGVGTSNTAVSLKLINKDDLTDAANEFEKWNEAGGKVVAGLLRRRMAEESRVGCMNLIFLTKFKPFLGWLKSAYSEADGSGSSTRVHMAAIIAFILGVGVSFCVSVHKHVITPEQFNSFLAAAATFITSTCGVLYGLNKAGSFFDGKNKQDPPQQ